MYVQPVLKCYSLGDNLLRRLVDCVYCDVYSGLKCQLSGDAPQSSWSLINDVIIVVIQIPYPLQFGARDQDCVLVKRTRVW